MEVEKLVLEILEKNFSGDKIKFGGDGRHFNLIIISEKFNGLSLLDRSRLVHTHLKELIDSDRLHALSMELKTPKEIPNG
jgi:acid stress-induced BolA-like protein IbaG/YrbA